MEKMNFEKLFARAAIELFDDFDPIGGLTPFLSTKLPEKYGISPGFLVNNQKEFSPQLGLIYNRLTCPKLYTDREKKLPLIPVPQVYGAVFYSQNLNQPSFNTLLERHQSFNHIFENQVTDTEDVMLPLSIWFAEDLASFLTMDDLEDRLMAESRPPDLVLILNRGLLISLNKNTIEQIFALEQKKDTQSFEKTLYADLVDITEKTLTTRYFKMGSSARYENFFYFYIFLLDLLNKQTLKKGGLNPEMVAIWPK